jgi:DNA-binding transcriptional ArsR family regulator
MTMSRTSISTMLAHPTRRAILRAYLAAPEGQRHSPVRLSEELQLPVNEVAYHFRVLARNEALIPWGTRPVRGATEHFYALGPLVKENEDAVALLLEADEKVDQEGDQEGGTSSLIV